MKLGDAGSGRTAAAPPRRLGGAVSPGADALDSRRLSTGRGFSRFYRCFSVFPLIWAGAIPLVGFVGHPHGAGHYEPFSSEPSPGPGVVQFGVSDTLASAGELRGRVLGLLGEGPPSPVGGVTVSSVRGDQQAVTDEAGRFLLRRLSPGTHQVEFQVLGCRVATQAVEIHPSAVGEVDFVIQPIVRLPGFIVDPQEDELRSQTPGDGVRIRPRPGSGARSIEQLIRGTFPGVRVVQGSGLPGSEASIQFRGPSSVSTGGAPLIVVDGSPAVGGAVDLNPDDVEEITLLRGASAAALYGARGQAGVIEIRTRRGPGAVGADGPLILVDGVVSSVGLSDIDPSGVVRVTVIAGTTAALVLGETVERSGVLHVTTAAGRGGEAPFLSECPPIP